MSEALEIIANRAIVPASLISHDQAERALRPNGVHCRDCGVLFRYQEFFDHDCPEQKRRLEQANIDMAMGRR